jgi:hypothetical protein
MALIERWCAILSSIKAKVDQRKVILNADIRCYSYYKRAGVYLFKPENADIADKMKIPILHQYTKQDLLFFDPIRGVGRSNSFDSTVIEWYESLISDGYSVCVPSYIKTNSDARYVSNYTSCQSMLLIPHKCFMYIIPSSVDIDCLNVWNIDSKGLFSLKLSSSGLVDSVSSWERFEFSNFDLSMVIFAANMVRNMRFLGRGVTDGCVFPVSISDHFSKYFKEYNQKYVAKGISSGRGFLLSKKNYIFFNKFSMYLRRDFLDSNFYLNLSSVNYTFKLQRIGYADKTIKRGMSICHRNYKTYKNLYKVRDVELIVPNISGDNVLEKGDIVPLNDKPENVSNLAYVRRGFVDLDKVEYPKLIVGSENTKGALISSPGVARSGGYLSSSAVGLIEDDMKKASVKFRYPSDKVHGEDYNVFNRPKFVPKVNLILSNSILRTNYASSYSSKMDSIAGMDFGE